ncbi:GNRHR [Mytilus edulis]|uniref:GNRHR n=1 Tax=Mytilus edulis TaxID=6550 RepID=A0A8S3PXG2_MYTED|nr:GNRHR [Mytilus edulis]
MEEEYMVTIQNFNMHQEQLMYSNYSSIKVADMNQQIPTVIYILVLIITGVIGNSTALFIFTKFYKESTYRVFVRSLSFVDLMVCMTHMPLEIMYLLKLSWFYNEAACKTYRYFDYCLNYLSIVLIVLIAIERYLKICKPLSKWQISAKLSNKLSVLGILIAAVAALPRIFTNGNHVIVVENVTLIACGVDHEDQYETVSFVIYFSIVGLMYVSVTVFLTFAYSSIIKTIFQRQNNLFRGQPSKHLSTIVTNIRRSSDQNNEQETSFDQEIIQAKRASVRTTKTLFIITVTFVLAHMPFVIMSFVVGLDSSISANLKNPKLSLYQIGMRLYMVNNVINPIVYGLTDTRFQRAGRYIYQNCNCKKGIVHANSSIS